MPSHLVINALSRVGYYVDIDAKSLKFEPK